jgi:hypothetical protein
MTKGTNLKVGLKILFKLIMNIFRKVLSWYFHYIK